MRQNATARHKLQARWSHVRNWGGVYARERCTRIEKIFAPYSQKPTTTRQNRAKNVA
jgi:hypothetical protein